MSKKFTIDFIKAHANDVYKVYTAKELAESSGVRLQWIETCIEYGKMQGTLDRIEFIQFWEVVIAWVPFVLDTLKKSKEWIAISLNCDVKTIEEIYGLSKLADEIMSKSKNNSVYVN